MDWDWINSPRISSEYKKGVEEFIQFAQRYEGRSDDDVMFRCPLNGEKLNATEVQNILFMMVSLEVIQYGHGTMN